MKAMILAAGRGERLRPLTDTRPKALVAVRGRPLIEWQVMRLAAAGFTELVINCAWLGEQIEAYLGAGERYGVQIRYSHEVDALETLGGIVAALPLLGTYPFLVVSADIDTGFDYATLKQQAYAIAPADAAYDAHFVLVDNPPWHASGDMGLDDRGTITLEAPRLTYANIGVFHPRLFTGMAPGVKQKLFPWAFELVAQGRVSGSWYGGTWHNVGNVDDLARANASH